MEQQMLVMALLATFLATILMGGIVMISALTKASKRRAKAGLEPDIEKGQMDCQIEKSLPSEMEAEFLSQLTSACPLKRQRALSLIQQYVRTCDQDESLANSPNFLNTLGSYLGDKILALPLDATFPTNDVQFCTFYLLIFQTATIIARQGPHGCPFSGQVLLHSLDFFASHSATWPIDESILGLLKSFPFATIQGQDKVHLLSFIRFIIENHHRVPDQPYVDYFPSLFQSLVEIWPEDISQDKIIVKAAFDCLQAYLSLTTIRQHLNYHVLQELKPLIMALILVDSSKADLIDFGICHILCEALDAGDRIGHISKLLVVELISLGPLPQGAYTDLLHKMTENAGSVISSETILLDLEILYHLVEDNMHGVQLLLEQGALETVFAIYSRMEQREDVEDARVKLISLLTSIIETLKEHEMVKYITTIKLVPRIREFLDRYHIALPFNSNSTNSCSNS